MRMITKAMVAAGFVCATAVGTSGASLAQGIYIQGPGVEFGIGQPYRSRDYRSYDYDRPSVYIERQYESRQDVDRSDRRSYRRDRDGDRDRNRY